MNDISIDLNVVGKKDLAQLYYFLQEWHDRGLHDSFYDNDEELTLVVENYEEKEPVNLDGSPPSLEKNLLRYIVFMGGKPDENIKVYLKNSYNEFCTMRQFKHNMGFTFSKKLKNDNKKLKYSFEFNCYEITDEQIFWIMRGLEHFLTYYSPSEEFTATKLEFSLDDDDEYVVIFLVDEKGTCARQDGSELKIFRPRASSKHNDNDDHDDDHNDDDDDGYDDDDDYDDE